MCLKITDLVSEESHRRHKFVRFGVATIGQLPGFRDLPGKATGRIWRSVKSGGRIKSLDLTVRRCQADCR